MSSIVRCISEDVTRRADEVRCSHCCAFSLTVSSKASSREYMVGLHASVQHPHLLATTLQYPQVERSILARQLDGEGVGTIMPTSSIATAMGFVGLGASSAIVGLSTDV